MECRFCGDEVSLKIMKRDHGPIAPKCMGHRWYKWWCAQGMCFAGQCAALIDLAGGAMTKNVPCYVYWEVEMVEFVPVVPVWVYDLAVKLTHDKELSRRLGFTQKRRLILSAADAAKGRSPLRSSSSTTLTDKRGVWEVCDADKVMPIKMRAKILRVAMNNELAREMIMDDPEAAGRLIRDLL